MKIIVDKECYDDQSLVIGGEEVETVSNFCYLGGSLQTAMMTPMRLIGELSLLKLQMFHWQRFGRIIQYYSTPKCEFSSALHFQ